MGDFSIKRSGKPPLTFRGETIAEAGGAWHAGRECNRWHDLAVYQTEGGRYVVRVVYRTRWQGEDDHHVAEVLDDPRAVQAWFEAHDPTGPVQGYPAGDAYAEKQARLMDDVRRRYEARLSDVYDELVALGDEFGEPVD